jgi:hypothetical protein
MRKILKYLLLIIILIQIEIYASDGTQDTEINKSKLGTFTDSTKKITPEEFFYANMPRYTVTGDLPLRDTDIKPWNLAGFGAVYGTFFYLQHKWQMETIWTEQTSFRIMEDGEYALWADKAGHFFGTYYMGYFMSEGLLQAGLSWEAATIWGGVMGLAYNTYVEILDGYGANWGFSPSDFYCDIAGAAFFIGQYYSPFLQNFTPKFSYMPPKWHGQNDRVPHDQFIDNYSSHTMWLSINVHNLLPKAMKPYWPKWLELSIGYAARNLYAPGSTEPYDPEKSLKVSDKAWGDRRFIIALDYNLVHLIPDAKGSFWNWLRQSANYLKFPAPAISFGDSGTKYFLFYPFEL